MTKIVHNKLLAGWYVVRGPHHTPLSGKFATKAEAKAWLTRRERLATMSAAEVAKVERLIAEGWGETGIKHETGLSTAQINAVFANVHAR